jgi:hypothetical protein
VVAFMPQLFIDPFAFACCVCLVCRQTAEGHWGRNRLGACVLRHSIRTQHVTCLRIFFLNVSYNRVVVCT